MSNKLFVGGLSWDTSEKGLKEAFEQYGAVTEAAVITDKWTGKSRGFGFVTFANTQDARVAMSEMDGEELDGRTVNVDLARPRPKRDSYGGGGRNW